MNSRSRPLGGIASLVLGVAPTDGAAPALSESGTQIPLLEDRSTYTQIATYTQQHASVKHSLKLYTSLDFVLPEELAGGLTDGFVADLELNSLHQISLGWSEEAGSDRPLRLVSCSTSSGEKASERGYKEWVFESTDGTTKI